MSKEKEKSNKFLSRDGYACVEEFVGLAKAIDKEAAAQQLKVEEIYYVSRGIPKYDREKAKKLGDTFAKRRAQPIKMKKKMPQAGARLKMVVLLRTYRKLDDSFDKDIGRALKAIDAHNKAAEAAIVKFKSEGKKRREVAGKEFDKNISALEKVLAAGGIKSKDIAIGQSMMGKSVLVRLPNGGVISIGKADEERFEKAKAKPVEQKESKGEAKKEVKKKDKTVAKSKDSKKSPVSVSDKRKKRSR